MAELLKRIVTLSNGKRVANFSSPHDFVFEDGTVLPAVSNEEAERLKVNFEEIDLGDGDIELRFTLSETVYKEMDKWRVLHEVGDVDIVFCPLPMIVAMREFYDIFYIKNTPFRAIRMVSRLDKNISISKQCV